jgi:hypothetical protein
MCLHLGLPDNNIKEASINNRGRHGTVFVDHNYQGS